MTLVSFFLRVCSVRKKGVPRNFACTKKIFYLSVEPVITVKNMRPCARCTFFSVEIIQFRSFWWAIKRFTSLKGCKNLLKADWRWLLSLQVLCKTQVGLTGYMARQRWKLLRMSTKQGGKFWILDFWKTNKQQLLWSWYTLLCKKHHLLVKEWKTISLSEQISPPFTNNHTCTWAKHAGTVKFTALSYRAIFG